MLLLSEQELWLLDAAPSAGGPRGTALGPEYDVAVERLLAHGLIRDVLHDFKDGTAYRQILKTERGARELELQRLAQKVRR